MLGGCASGGAGTDQRFFEKYVLDAQRASQEEDSARAERLLRLAVTAGEKLGGSDWRLALAQGRLGKVLLDNQKAEEATKVLSSSVDHFRAARPTSPDIANLIAKERGETASLLGLLLVQKNDYASARSYLEEAASLLSPFWEQAKEERERDTLAGIGYARALYGLALMSRQTGDDVGAEKNYEAALRVIDEESVPVPLRDDVAGSYSNFLRSKKRLQKAEQVDAKQEAYERFNPGGPKAVARDAWRDALAKGRDAAHDDLMEKADQHFSEAYKQVNLFEKSGDDALQTIIEWSRVKQRINDPAAADKLLEQARDMALKVGGQRSIQYDNYLQGKERVLKLQRKYAEEEAVLLEQVRLREELRGKDNFHVAETLKRLATCQNRLNKLPEAVDYSKKAIAIFKKSPQRNIRELKEAYDDLIAMLEKSGDEEELRKYKFERAVLRRDTIKSDSQKTGN